MDGSVRHLKDTIDSWGFIVTDSDPWAGAPLHHMVTVPAIQEVSKYTCRLVPGARVGILQALSTKSGGEVISADAY
jgi:hypothetical protein